MEKDKILLIGLAGIGDAVLSSAAIRNLRQNHPDSFISILTFPAPGQILQKSPYLDKVFILHKGLRGVLSGLLLFKQLRNLHFDVVVNLKQHHTRRGMVNMILLLKAIAAKKSLGRNTDGKGFFYDMKIEDTINTQRRDTEYMLDLMHKLDCQINDKQLEVWFDDNDLARVRQLLEKNGVLQKDILVGINPEARRPSHRWDWKNFAEVAEELSARYKMRVVITGTKQAAGLAKKISGRMSVKPLDLCGKLSLTQLIPLIRRCNVYISGDTAPMHIANALKTPLAAIMGPGIMKTAPYQEENCIILRKQVDCWPCYKFRCKHMKCLKIITPNEVIAAASSLLKDYVKD